MSTLERLIASEQKRLDVILGTVSPSDRTCRRGIRVHHRLVGLRIARDLTARELTAAQSGSTVSEPPQEA